VFFYPARPGGKQNQASRIATSVSLIEFGEKVDASAMISEQLAIFPKLSSVDATLLMRDRYETYFGIHNHDADESNDPLALVAYRAAEDNKPASRLYERITEFAERKVPRYFNMSLDEFMGCPRDIIEHILVTCRKMEEDEGKKSNRENEALQRALGMDNKTMNSKFGPL
jgi:hypothetical protein